MGKQIKSILVKDMDYCIFCGKPREAIHHVFYGNGMRKLSDKYHLVVPLCNYHHNMSNESVHFNYERDLGLKMDAQLKFEKKYSHEQFMAVFGKNYL